MNQQVFTAGSIIMANINTCKGKRKVCKHAQELRTSINERFFTCFCSTIAGLCTLCGKIYSHDTLQTHEGVCGRCYKKMGEVNAPCDHIYSPSQDEKYVECSVCKMVFCFCIYCVEVFPAMSARNWTYCKRCKPSDSQGNFPQEEPQVTQEEPQVTQEEPQVTQEEPQVTQEEPQVTQEEPQVTQLLTDLFPDDETREKQNRILEEKGQEEELINFLLIQRVEQTIENKEEILRKQWLELLQKPSDLIVRQTRQRCEKAITKYLRKMHSCQSSPQGTREESMQQPTGTNPKKKCVASSTLKKISKLQEILEAKRQEREEELYEKKKLLEQGLKLLNFKVSGVPFLKTIIHADDVYLEEDEDELQYRTTSRKRKFFLESP